MIQWQLEVGWPLHINQWSRCFAEGFCLVVIYSNGLKWRIASLSLGSSTYRTLFFRWGRDLPLFLGMSLNPLPFWEFPVFSWEIQEGSSWIFFFKTQIKSGKMKVWDLGSPTKKYCKNPGGERYLASCIRGRSPNYTLPLHHFYPFVVVVVVAFFF